VQRRPHAATNVKVDQARQLIVKMSAEQKNPGGLRDNLISTVQE
jgi:hypothetical protein